MKTEVPRGLAARLIVEDQADAGEPGGDSASSGGDGAAADGVAEAEALLCERAESAARSLRRQGKRQ